MKRSRIILAAVLSVAVLSATATSVVLAADEKKTESSKNTSTAIQQNTSGSGVQGYAADKPLQTGTIVQLVGDKANKVAPANQASLGRMYGVIVDPMQLSVTISNSGLQNEVQVATSGTFDVLVSNQGGAIQKGDYVTLSALEGVAMKASADQKTVFGRAAASFNDKTDGVGSTTLKDSAGKTKNVTLGIMPVAIDVRSNPNDKSTKANVPKVLQRLGEAIAEKPVGPLRMYLSIAITGISIIAAMVILYSGVRSSLFSIGRNPLSKKSIFRGLLEIILTSILILIIGLFAVYLLLKL